MNTQGQDPDRSFSGDENGLDLGTVVVPLSNPFINKEVIGVINPDGTPDGDGLVDEPGDVILYRIDVINTGFADLTNVTLSDELLEGPGGTLTGPTESNNTDGILVRG
jgi:uncharacterized repeat protein (TIGR01451 family)